VVDEGLKGLGFVRSPGAARVGLLSSLIVGCAAAPPVPQVAAPLTPAAVSFTDDPKPLHFRSARFELSVPFPDGHGWRIDDHHTPMLVATHAATESTLTLGLSAEPQLMNRQRCEAAARERGLVHDDAFQTVADEVIVGPGPYDTHVTVSALPATAPHRSLSGHVFLFGAYMRKCLFVHFETKEREGEDEAALSARLAVARLQMLGGIKVEAFDVPEVGRR
jgi:hypothetical protein